VLLPDLCAPGTCPPAAMSDLRFGLCEYLARLLSVLLSFCRARALSRCMSVCWSESTEPRSSVCMRMYVCACVHVCVCVCLINQIYATSLQGVCSAAIPPLQPKTQNAILTPLPHPSPLATSRARSAYSNTGVLERALRRALQSSFTHSRAA
jgi:hypothetical protein